MVTVIKVTRSDGSRIEVDSRNRKKEYNASGKRVVRVVKTPSGKISNYNKLSPSDRRTYDRYLRGAELITQEQKRKQAVAEAIIRDLNASAQRTANRRERAVQLLRHTAGGRMTLTALSKKAAEIHLEKIKDSPYSQKYKNELKAYIASLTATKTSRKKNRYGEVVIDGVVFVPESQREANYLNNLKKTIVRDKKLREDWDKALKKSNLTVKAGDKWYIKAYKGAGQTGLGFLNSGRFIGNASDKLVAAVAGIGASKRIRSSVVSEAGRAARETPKAVGESFDPRKPENWANIILFAIAVNSLAQASLSKSASPRRVTTAAKKTDKALTKVKAAKKAASKNAKKNASPLKKLRKQEKALLAKKKALTKRLKEIRKEKPVKAKLKQKTIKSKQQSALIKKIKKQISAARSRRQVNNILKRARKSGLSDRQLSKLRKQSAKNTFKKVLEKDKKLTRRAKAQKKSKAAAKKKSDRLSKKAKVLRVKSKAKLKLKEQELRLKRLYSKYEKLIKKVKSKQEAAKILRRARKSGLSARQLKKLKLESAKNTVKKVLQRRRELEAKIKAAKKRIGKTKKAQRRTTEKVLRKAQRQKLIRAFENRLKNAKTTKAVNELFRRAKKAGLNNKQVAALKNKYKNYVKARSQKAIQKKAASARKKAARQMPRLAKKSAKISKLQSDIDKIMREVNKLSPRQKALMRIKAATPSKAKPKAVKVQTAGGQVLLLAEPTTKIKGAVTVKPPVLKGAVTYESAVLALAKIGKPPRVKPTTAKRLHNDYYSIFRTGNVPRRLTTPKIGVSPFSKIGDISKRRPATLRDTKSRSRAMPKEDNIIRSINRLADRIAIANDVVRINQLLQKLDLLRVRLRRTSKRKRLKFNWPKIKKKLTKRRKDELDKIYSKIKKKYRPSLAAILFGIYGYRPKVITGLEIRPIPKRRKSVRNRKNR